MSMTAHTQEIAGFLTENAELRAYVTTCAESAVVILDTISTIFPEYTGHGGSHALAVLRLGASLSSGNLLSPWEKAVFALAAYHHDIGMASGQDELRGLLESDDFRRLEPYLQRTLAAAIRLDVTDPETINRSILVEYIRRQHDFRSALWIRRQYPKEQRQSYVDGVYPWDALALLAQAHALDLDALDSSSYSCETLLGCSDR